jgi:hypothetical protein
MTLRIEAASVDNGSLREVERRSIRDWVSVHASALTGRVLDYGAGQQPYRGIVEAAGGEYVPFDRAAFPGSCAEADAGPDGWMHEQWDAILCTQVLQYLSPSWLEQVVGYWAYALSKAQGALVLSYGTCWPEVERSDHLRLTHAGVEWLLGEAGFSVDAHERRAEIVLGGGLTLPLGGALLAHAR